MSALAVLAVLCGLPTASMADQTTTERVAFAKGSSAATIEGMVKGRDAVHYLVGAKAGQTMKVSLSSKNQSTYFNVFAPGKVPGQDAALYMSDTDGNSFESVLPETGDYLVQVYLFRNAARNNEKSRFTLAVAVEGMSQTSGDALVPGTDFNATGEVPCARVGGQPMGSCKFGVKREGNGNGAVTVFWPDGGDRVIFFEAGAPVSYNESQADGGAKMTVGQKEDLFLIRIGEQRFEIPDAVISGG